MARRFTFDRSNKFDFHQGNKNLVLNDLTQDQDVVDILEHNARVALLGDDELIDQERLPGYLTEAGFAPAIAGEIEDAGSVVRDALSASTDARTPFVELALQAGVDPTGVTECAAAINTAAAACLALGARLHAKGTYKIASTVTIAGNADLGDATFNYTGTSGTAVRIGTATSGSFVYRIQVVAPKIIATAKTTTGWSQVAGTIGLDLSNLYASFVAVPHIQEFETGMRNYGKGAGFAYNTVRVGHLYNNKINQFVDSDATGWSNQNLYLGGQFSHISGEGTNVAGARHIEMVNSASVPNNNLWLNPSLEGNVSEFHAIVAGAYNVIDYGRWEAATPKVKWAPAAVRNEIRGGYNAEAIVETWGAAASINSITARGTSKIRGYGSAVQILENSLSTTSPVDIIMTAGAAAAGASPATAYTVSRAPNLTRMKRSTDTYDRLQFDHVNGRISFGDGTVSTLPQYFTGVSNVGVSLNGGHFYFNADNTSDIGAAASLRPRDLNLGRDLNVGRNATIPGVITHTGTAVGFYGTTPAARPSAYTQTYSTATRTQAALTSANAASAPTQAEYDALRADLINVKQVLNQVLDDLQTLGLLQ